MSFRHWFSDTLHHRRLSMQLESKLKQTRPPLPEAVTHCRCQNNWTQGGERTAVKICGKKKKREQKLFKVSYGRKNHCTIQVSGSVEVNSAANNIAKKIKIKIKASCEGTVQIDNRKSCIKRASVWYLKSSGPSSLSELKTVGQYLMISPDFYSLRTADTVYHQHRRRN